MPPDFNRHAPSLPDSQTHSLHQLWTCQLKQGDRGWHYRARYSKSQAAIRVPQLRCLRHKIFIPPVVSLFIWLPEAKEPKNLQAIRISLWHLKHVSKVPKLIWSMDRTMAYVSVNSFFKKKKMSHFFKITWLHFLNHQAVSVFTHPVMRTRSNTLQRNMCCKTPMKFTIYISQVSLKE